MRIADRIRTLLQDCSGHSPAEYALLALLLGVGLATAVITYLGASQGAVILTASRLG